MIVEYSMVLLTFMPGSQSALIHQTQHQFPTQMQCENTREGFEEMLQDLLARIKGAHAQTYVCIPTLGKPEIEPTAKSPPQQQ